MRLITPIIKFEGNIINLSDQVTVEVYLHGHLIAEVDDVSLKLYDGGYQSQTTKSRLNALLSEFGYTCGTKQEYIFQKQYEWFIQMFDLTEKAMRTIPFPTECVLLDDNSGGLISPSIVFTFSL